MGLSDSNVSAISAFSLACHLSRSATRSMQPSLVRKIGDAAQLLHSLSLGFPVLSV